MSDTGKEGSLKDFEKLIYDTTKALNDDARQRMEYYLTRNGKDLETDIYEMMKKISKGSPFEKKIELISGQKFPDIIVDKRFGLEVKSSKDNHWITIGNSVLESTRVQDIENIYLILGKLTNPVEFKTKPYEKCLADVVVTHYPRYKVDMNIEEGNTIFDKMDLSYDEIRKLDNPVDPIVEYYKEQLKEGESLWWIDNSTENKIASPIKIRLWKTIPPNEKETLVATGFALFPDVFSNHQNKYERFTLWLVSSQSIVVPSTRDPFSAGGQRKIITQSGKKYCLPQKFVKIQNLKEEIVNQIISTEEDILKDIWNVTDIDSNRIEQWINLVESQCPTVNGVGERINTKEILREIFYSAL